MVDAGEDFLRRVEAGERTALAKAITLVERGDVEADDLLSALRGRQGKAWRVGITGPSGAGKSSLIAAMVGKLVASGKRVAILAVDPSSPFTYGAILGDRVRMQDLAGEDKVYMRSMATRGKRGGLAHRTGEAADVLDAAGFDYIFIESVGVGQAEFEIRSLVDTVIVVLVPESGDRVQAIKAGLMEIADIYVVNKNDRPGSSVMLRTIQSSLAYQHHFDAGWTARVIGTSAINDDGVDNLTSELERHVSYLRKDGLHAVRRRRIESRLRDLIDEMLVRSFWSRSDSELFQQAVDDVVSGQISIQAAISGLAGECKNAR